MAAAAIENTLKLITDKLLLGRCLPRLQPKVVRVEVPLLVLNEYLLTYFKETKVFSAYDMTGNCKSGDMVLIRKLNDIKLPSVTHEIVSIEYPLGDVTDPVTGEKCVNSKRRDTMEMEAQLYGENVNRFQYSKAPKRGRLEGIRDLTDRPVYVKYHDFQGTEKDFNDPYCT